MRKLSGFAVSITTVPGAAKTADTFPAASLAQGYSVWLPTTAAVYVAGAVRPPGRSR